MAFHQLRHFNRIHTLQENGYKCFALIAGPSKGETYQDFCVTLVRCKNKNVAKELRRWGYFKQSDIEAIEELDHGETYEADYASKIIRLS